jgi:glycosyltransferase involved in cell wall biosynthesis
VNTTRMGCFTRCFNAHACYAWALKHLVKHPIRVVFTLHGLFNPFTFRTAAIHGAHVVGLLGADRVVGCSEEIGRRYSSIPLIGRKLETIQNCMATNERHEPERTMKARAGARQQIASQWGLDEQKLWIATVGRLTEQKNHALFLRVAGEVIKRHGMGARAHFLIVGDGELRPQLEAEAAALGLTEHVTFTSFVADMDALWPALDLLLLTSVWEGTPMCVLEAMAYGKPVVSTAVGGVPDVVRHGQTGYLVESSDAKELGDRVRCLLEDDALRLTLGTAARHEVETRLSPQRWAEAHVKLYERVLES